MWVIALLAGSSGGAASVWAAGQADDEDEIVGFVLEVSGTWILDGSNPRKVSGGDPLPAGARLRPAPNAGKYIIICHYTGKAERYTSAVELPRRTDPSLTQRIWRAIAGRPRGGLVRASVRGSDLLEDAVLQLKDGQMDLRPALQGLPAGYWKLELTTALPKLNQTPDAAKAVKEASVLWDAEQSDSGLVQVDQFKAGLYELTVMDPNTGELAGDPVLVLVCDPSVFEENRKQFEEALALTKSWDKETRQAAAGHFLQFALEALADPAQRPADTPRE
jgi:hypothetical protein